MSFTCDRRLLLPIDIYMTANAKSLSRILKVSPKSRTSSEVGIDKRISKSVYSDSCPPAAYDKERSDVG